MKKVREVPVTYEVAKLAAEKGFDLVTDEYYSSQTKVTSVSYNKYPAPTQSLLQKWLRDEHKIEVYVVPHSIEYKSGVFYEVVVDKLGTTWSGCESYEHALEVGLKEALMLLHNE